MTAFYWLEGPRGPLNLIISPCTPHNKLKVCIIVYNNLCIINYTLNFIRLGIKLWCIQQSNYVIVSTIKKEKEKKLFSN